MGMDQNTEEPESGNQPEDETVQAAEESPSEDEKAEVCAFVAGLEERYAQKAAFRQQNLNVTHPSEEYFFKYDSSVKKNTALVKKLKQFTAQQLTAIMSDVRTLNLTKYISEVSAALVEAKLKMSDIPAIITLCNYLHQTYAEFSSTMFENWQKLLLIKPGEKVQNASKMRVDLRFYAELVSVGIFSNKIGLPLLGACLVGLIAQDKEEHINLSIVLSFCKHCGDEYAGLLSARMSKLAAKYEIEIPVSTLLPPDKQCSLRNLLKDYYHSLAEHLRIEHGQLQQAEKSKWKMLHMKGEITTEKREQLLQLQSSYTKLFASTETLADLLGEPMPVLLAAPEASVPPEGTVVDEKGEGLEFGPLDPWRDDETKSFYVDLPDLRQFLPNFCGKREEEEVDLGVDVEPPITEEVLDQDPELDEELTESEIKAFVEQQQQQQQVESGEVVEGAAEAPDTPARVDDANGAQNGGANNRKQFEQFAQSLHNCVNRDLIDNAAIEFLLNFNTKSKRKRLVKVLFGVQRTRLDLLPMYARFVAIINLVATDLGAELCQMLKVDFKYHIKKKDQINIETKIKVVRYIGELVKFNIYKKLDALYCLRCLLQSFQHHYIEMTCAFLEVCGVYLYNCRESRMRTNAFLEQMMRLKTNTTMNGRYAQLVENCYYLVKRPEGLRMARKVRPLMHTYIRHLIYRELNKTNADKLIKLLRRLNWDDPDTFEYTVKCLSKAYNVRYHLIRDLADLVSGLASYQEKAVIRVVDTVFEDIRAGLEIHDNKLAQRRVAMVKYLGELYNYQLVEATNILNTLYSIISYGVQTMPDAPPSAVDPPGSLFRLKLVCVLLDTCGMYFTSGLNRKLLDYFIVFFQHYYWIKRSHPCFQVTGERDLFPILDDQMYRECLRNLRPKLKLHTSYERAAAAVEALRQKLYPESTEHDGDPLMSGGAEWEEWKQKQQQQQDQLDSIKETSELLTDQRSESDEYSSDVGDMSETYDLGGNAPYDDYEDANNAGAGTTDQDQDDQEYDRSTPVGTEQERMPEDLDFEREYERMASDCYQQRVRDSNKIHPKQIPTPVSFRNETKKTYDQLQMPNQQKSDMVPFALMIRSKGKQQQYKTFEAPEDSQLAQYIREQERRQQEEKDSVKRLTLNISERLEEEDYQELLAQSSRGPDTMRPRPVKPVKFKHPRGVPDVDAIFH
ncbi:regulator of nonsense transcripts 2 [Anopheles aquasalis]|uniref:regulator of nonsense transcripts 2 n=1 Tax=Anopheles aquasalis TaxID=42839 RepID=UPI00215B3C76|nr:regulator of nonsense transcripts 2 [Anopheles aquasalis]